MIGHRAITAVVAALAVNQMVVKVPQVHHFRDALRIALVELLAHEDVVEVLVVPVEDVRIADIASGPTNGEFVGGVLQ